MQRRSARRASARKPALMFSLRPLAWSAVAILALARVAAAGDATTDVASPPTPPTRPADLGAPKTPAPAKSDDAERGQDRRARQGRQCRRRAAADLA